MITAPLSLFLNLLLLKSTLGQANIFDKIKLPSDTWLGASPLLSSLEPNPGNFSCYYDVCGAPGQGFLDVVMTRCNTSVSSMNLNNPVSVTKLRETIEECFCGKTAADFNALNVLWLNCVACLTSGVDTSHKSSLDSKTFEDACSCVKPGRIEALTKLGDSSFTCQEHDRVKTRSSRGVRSPHDWNVTRTNSGPSKV